MFLLAWRQGQLDPLRTVLTGMALGAVIAVILVLEGFEQGLYYQLERAVLNRNSDLIAAEPGVSNFLVGGSSLPQLSREEVESVPGVLDAQPITLIPVIYEKDAVRTPIIVFVTDVKGGPSKIVAGRDVTQARDIVVDAALAANYDYDIRVGDALIVSDFEFRVSGITEDDAALFVPFACISYDGMIDFFLDSEIAPDISTFPLLSFLLIEHDSTADRDHIAAGTAVPDDKPIVLVLESKRDLWEVCWQLLRIGYDLPKGWLSEGMMGWRTAAKPLEILPQWNVWQLHECLEKDRELTVLDVRQPGEWKAGQEISANLSYVVLLTKHGTALAKGQRSK